MNSFLKGDNENDCKDKKKKNAFINCVVNDSKKSRFNKEQKTSGSLNNLGLKTPLSKIPILSNILLWRYKMNEIVNKFC